MNFLLEYVELLEKQKQANIGMGNLNVLDKGLRRLLMTKVEPYYKWKYDDHENKRSVLQSSFGANSQVMAMPGVTGKSKVEDVVEAFKTAKEAKVMVLQVGEHQIAMVFKAMSKAGYLEFGLGLSDKTKELAAKDVTDAQVKSLGDRKKAEAIKGIDSYHGYSPEEKARLKAEAEMTLDHHEKARDELNMNSLSKLVTKEFEQIGSSSHDKVDGWKLAGGGAHGLAKAKMTAFLKHLIKFAQAELGEGATVKWLAVTADAERVKMHAEREKAKQGLVPRSEENLYAKKAFKLGKFEAIENGSYINKDYQKYVSGLKKGLQQRLAIFKTEKKNEAVGLVVDSAQDLHKLISSGKFHEKFKLVVNGKTHIYDYGDDRIRYDSLVKKAKGDRVYDSDEPYIEFRLHGGDKGGEAYEARKTLRKAQAEIEAKVEKGEITETDGKTQLEALEREYIETQPPGKIYLYMKLSGFGMIVSEIGLQPEGSWSSSKNEMILFKVNYDSSGQVTGLTPERKA